MIFILFILTTLFRLLPHAANFTPVGTAILFVGKKHGVFKGILFGLGVMILSDLFLGFSFASLFVYTGFALYALASPLIKKRKIGYVLAPVIGSISFFFISNFGVWLGSWYSHDLSGLTRCFVAAIPFYRNTILGDVIFMAVIFGADYVYNKWVKSSIFRSKEIVKQEKTAGF